MMHAKWILVLWINFGGSQVAVQTVPFTFDSETNCQRAGEYWSPGQQKPGLHYTCLPNWSMP